MWQEFCAERMIIDTWTYNKIDFIQLRHESREQS